MLMMFQMKAKGSETKEGLAGGVSKTSTTNTGECFQYHIYQLWIAV